MGAIPLKDQHGWSMPRKVNVNTFRDDGKSSNEGMCGDKSALERNS